MENKSYLIITHVLSTGPAQELEKFLNANNTKKVVFIGHPFSFSKNRRSFVYEYKNGKKIKEKYGKDWKLPELFIYIKDILTSLFWGIKFGRYDICICADNLNTFAGIWLRKIGICRKVIYYTIDYNPKRFNNKLLNAVYHWLDNYCVRKCNFAWNLSPVMVAEREKKGIDEKYRNKQFVVPVGTNQNIRRYNFREIDRYQLCYMGHLREGQGVDFLIKLMPEIVKKIPQAHLLIIGGGELESRFRKLVKNIRLEDKIKFTGFIKDHNRIENMITKSAIGIAPYVDDEKTYTRYTDPGKPKAYLAAGIPVIMTDIVHIARLIQDRQAGFAVNFNRQDFINKIIELLNKEKLLINFRRNAYELSKEFNWNIIFKKNLEKVL